MHEMSLAESVREIVENAAKGAGATAVKRVTLEIGKLSQVEVHAMRFAFEVVRAGSMAASAELDIVEIDGTAWCMACSQAVGLAARGDGCPACGSFQLQINGGDRMRVLHIEVD